MNPLVEWAVKREALRKNKEAGKPRFQWTDDPILQKYRFCNVRRFDDRVSRWLIKNVLLEEHIERNLDEFILFAALCRWVNWPPTIQELMTADLGLGTNSGLDLERAGAAVDYRKGLGCKAWTGAYMVRAPRKGSTKGKGHFIAVDVVKNGLGPALPAIKEALKTNSCYETFKAIRASFNHGDFMAGQIVADLGYTSLLRNATDTYTWAPQGPGSVRGLNRLLGLPLKRRWLDDDFCGILRGLRKDLIEALGPEYESLTLHDVQNCLCETDKYLRVKAGEGRPRATYTPETAF